MLVRALVVGLIARYVYTMYVFMDYGNDVKYNDESCSLRNPEMVGSEDLSLSRDGQTLFITQGDLHKTFHHGPKNSAEGHIYTLGIDDEEAVRAEIENFPSSMTFRPHGMYVSKTTDLMYVVNHLGDYSQVEVFKINYDTTPISLLYVRSIRDDQLFPKYGINDVVEGETEGEVYITQWLPFGLPSGGSNHGETFKEKVVNSLKTQVLLTGTTGLSLTRLFRCRWDVQDSNKPSRCELATSRTFVGANGITTNDDRTKIFVVDATAKQVVVFAKKTKRGYLTFDHVIHLPFAVDNIEYQSNGDLIMGSIPILHIAADAKGPQDPVPGGMLVATPKGSSGQEWVVSHPLLHDGTKMSQVSAAARFGKRIVLGSPYANGILVCE